MANFSKKRGSHGQALIEGAIALVLITSLVVVGALLIIGTGLAIYYKGKLAYAAQVGAKVGGESKYWLGAPRPGYNNSKLSSDVTKTVNSVLVGLGLPKAQDGKIHAQETAIDGVVGVKVTVEESGLEIISGGLLPPSITLMESAFCPYSTNDPIGVLGLSVEGQGDGPEGIGMFIPVYGGGARTGIVGHTGVPNPPGGVDYWRIGIVKDPTIANSTGKISIFGGLAENQVFDAPVRTPPPESSH